MFGFIKKLRENRRPGDSTSEAPPSPPPPPTATSAEPEPDPTVEPGAEPFVTKPFTPSLRDAKGMRLAYPRSKARMERLLIELKLITDRFSSEMQSLIAQQPKDSVIIALPVDGIVEQLHTGRVQVSIAELRRFAPVHTFVADTSRDEERVDLPLREVVQKIDPELLQRNTEKIVELPGDIEGVFAKEVVNEKDIQAKLASLRLIPGIEDHTSSELAEELAADAAMSGGGEYPDMLVISATALEPLNPPPAAEPEITPRGGIAAPAEVTALFERPVKGLETLIPLPVSNTPQPTKPVQPAGMAELRIDTPSPEPASPLAASTSEAALPPKPDPARPAVVPTSEQAPGQRTRAPIQLPEPAPGERRSVSLPRRAIVEIPPAPPRERRSAPSPAGAVEPTESAHGRTVTVPLAKVDTNWPDAIREETAGLGLSVAIQFPLAELGGALKRGKVAFPWRQLRAWLEPPLPAGESQYDPIVLEIPLSIVAPLFMTVSGSASQGTRIQVDESMPPLFSPETKKAATPVSEPGVASPVSAQLTTGAPGAEGGLPAEIVDRACTLHGVAGAVIALNDGLLVAARMPPDLKPETLAAFLPQVFSRLEQSVATMQLGEVQNLLFTAGDRPWQIWKAGPLFFAAMGHPNGLLPGAQLKVLSAQLARQSKV